MPHLTISPEIASELARRAREAGHSVPSLARAAGIGHGTAQRLLSGQPILIDRAQHVAALFGLQIEQFQRLKKI